MWLLRRPEAHAVARRSKASAIEVDVVARPGELHRTDGLIGHCLPRFKVTTERCELPFEVSSGHAENHAAAGEHIKAQYRLRGNERVAVREHQDMRL